MRIGKKSVSFLLAALMVLTVMVTGIVPGNLKAHAAGWNGYNYRGGTLYGSQSFLEAYGIDYDVYMKWLDDHDADSPNPDYYLGTPYVGEDHRNPHGDCDGAYGDYDVPGVEGMNCTGFVWHVLYKASVMSGAPWWKTDRLGVMAGMPGSWYNYDVYRVFFDSLEDAYDSGILEKGDLMWIYGSDDNHNAIFYGDNPHDWIYWDSAGERNRYCGIHAIGDCGGLWVAKVTQPNRIELQIDTPSGGSGVKFGSKYCVFNSREKAQAALDHPDNDAVWNQREGTIVLDSDGHGCFREHYAPPASELWTGSIARTNHPYFYSPALRVDSSNTYYAVQWSHGSGISQDDYIQVFTDSGKRTSTGYRIFRFYAPIKVKTPSITSIKSVSDGIRMKWNAVPGAYKYRLYYKNYQGSWRKLAETTSTGYLDKLVQRNCTYTYTIRCLDRYNNFISDCNLKGWSQKYTYADTPQVTKIENTPEGIKLSWTPVQNPVEAYGLQYRVYFKNSKGQWTRIGQTTEPEYLDDVIGHGRTYSYTIRCVDNTGDFVSGFNNTGWTHTYKGLETPQITEAVSEPEGVHLKWNPIDKATRYRVYYKSGSGWSKLCDTADTEAYDLLVSPGSTYTYTICCINDKNCQVSGFNRTGWKCTYQGIDTPQITSAVSEADGIRLKWEPVEGAVMYRIYYKNSAGNWARMAQTTDTEYLDNAVNLHNSYIYTIRCINAKGYFTSGFNKNGTKCTFNGVATPEISEIVNEPEGLRVKWKPTEGVAKYRLYRKNSAGNWQYLTETTDSEYYDGNVSYGNSYTYTIRCVNSYTRFSSDYNRTGRTQQYTGVDTPQISDLSSTADGVKLSWAPVEGASEYRVFCRSPKGWVLLSTVSSTEYLDTDIKPGESRNYTVRCYSAAKNAYTSSFVWAGWTVQYIQPEESLAETGEAFEPDTEE